MALRSLLFRSSSRSLISSCLSRSLLFRSSSQSPISSYLSRSGSGSSTLSSFHSSSLLQANDKANDKAKGKANDKAKGKANDKPIFKDHENLDLIDSGVDPAWLVVVEDEDPDNPYVVLEKEVARYVKIVADVVGSEDEAKKRIRLWFDFKKEKYALYRFFLFGTEDLANKVRNMPNVKEVSVYKEKPKSLVFKFRVPTFRH